MNETKVITAEQARGIKKQSIIQSLERLSNEIEKVAKDGYTSATWYGELKTEQVIYLEEVGFNVRTPSINYDYYYISW